MNEDVQTVFQRLSDRTPLQGLSPQSVWDQEMDDRIASWGTAGVKEKTLKAGLHLWNDSLYASHAISQEIDNPTGSFWHGLMHRMEKDYSNAKYWFRRVGEHPVYAILLERTADIWQHAEHSSRPDGLRILAEGKSWDPFGMVDLVQQALLNDDADLQIWLQRIQRLEMTCLLAYDDES